MPLLCSPCESHFREEFERDSCTCAQVRAEEQKECEIALEEIQRDDINRRVAESERHEEVLAQVSRELLEARSVRELYRPRRSVSGPLQVIYFYLRLCSNRIISNLRNRWRSFHVLLK